MGSLETQETIALDIDEVLYPFMPQFTQWHNKIFQTNLYPENFFSYEFADVLGVSVPDTIERVREFLTQEDNHEGVLPIQGSKSAVYALAEQYSLVAVTARHPQFRSITESYLEEHFSGVIEQVELVGHPATVEVCRSKAEVCQELGATALVDDSIGHVNNCVENGIDGVLFGNYPWNREGEPRKDVVQCHNWQDVLGYFGVQAATHQEI